MQLLSFQRVLALSLLCCGLSSAHSAFGSDDPLLTLKLNPLWRISFGSDLASTSDSRERDQHSTSGTIYYLPSLRSESGQTPYFRLLSKGGADHMDSLISGEGGYATEGVLGYPWTVSTAHPGLAPIVRFYNNQAGSNSAGDHAAGIGGDLLHSAESFPSYIAEAPMGYAYARFLNSNAETRSVTGGGVEIKSNLVTGGAVWEWWYKGKQFINDYDYGRQLSAAVYVGSHSLQEGGDVYGTPEIAVHSRHGSPVLAVTTQGSVQSTLAIPLEWTPALLGGDLNHPVIYPDVQLGKEIQLNWIGPDGVNRGWPLVQYETVFKSKGLSQAIVEAPTAYLNTEFRYYYSYDPVLNKLNKISIRQDKANIPGVPLSTAIIASGPDMGDLAMGVYIFDPNAGIVLYDESGDSSGQFGSSFSKFGVVYNGPVSAKQWKFKTWIVTDTVENIIKDFKTLYEWGVMSRDHAPPAATTTFDDSFYLQIYPDLSRDFGMEGFGQAYAHWHTTGLPREGRRGSPEFDPSYYLKRYPDMKAAFGSTGFQEALDYWLTIGLVTEGRQASAEFDPVYYLNRYPDLKAAFGATGFKSAADHWLSQGLSEGRAGSIEFDPSFYLNKYPDLLAAFGPHGYKAALIHWINYGKAEGRQGSQGR
jgi:hypothetical protein